MELPVYMRAASLGRDDAAAGSGAARDPSADETPGPVPPFESAGGICITIQVSGAAEKPARHPVL
jgi:hypothetical protein